MKLIIFIPAFNEEENIGEVIDTIPKIKGFDKQEIIVVDDGSTDKTAQIATNKGAIVISHPYNMGLGSGFQTGVKEALKREADIMVTVDADGQFPTENILEIIQPLLDKKADLCTASRFMKKEDEPKNISPTRLWGNKQIAKIISLLVGKRFYDVACGFRAYSRNALMHLNTFGKFTYTQEVFIDLSMKNLPIVEIPMGGIKYFKERKKRSRVFKGAFNYAKQSLAIIIRTIRDYKPMKFFGTIGLVLFLVGSIFDLFLLVHYLLTGVFTPYIFIGFIGSFLNILGIITSIVGLVADMFDRVNRNLENILYLLKIISYNKQKAVSRRRTN